MFFAVWFVTCGVILAEHKPVYIPPKPKKGSNGIAICQHKDRKGHPCVAATKRNPSCIYCGHRPPR